MSGIFEISYYVLIGVFGVMGLVLFILPRRDDPRLESYRVSLNLMAFSLLSLALYCSFKWAIPRQVFSTYFLMMSHLQCLLLGLAHINLVAPERVSKTFVWRNCLPLLACVLPYSLALLACGPTRLTSYAMLRDPEVMQSPEVVIRVVWMGVYIIQTVFFVSIFFRECGTYRRKADDYFSEVDARALRIVRTSFGFAISVAALTLFVTASLHPVVSAILNGGLLVLYTLMGVYYIQYPSVFPQMEPVICPQPEPAAEPAAEPQTAAPSADELLWQTLRTRIVDQRIYTRAGITMEGLAREMGLSRTHMSQLINHYEHCNFNTFINTLRIDYACRILQEQPDIRTSELSDMLGYSDVCNFYRYFKQAKHMTVKEYREGEA